MITSLQLRGLTVSRGPRRLFAELESGLAAGEALAVNGANGSGKTSLLRVIAGLLRPDAGEVRFADEGGNVDPDDARREALHLLGHQDGLKSSRTAGEELAFQARWTGAAADGISRAVETLALKPLLGLEVRMLSAGQRRRLALGRLVASPRPLWLLDEPFAPLDAERRAAFGQLMADHLAGGGMVVAAVHDPLPVSARVLELAA